MRITELSRTVARLATLATLLLGAGCADKTFAPHEASRTQVRLSFANSFAAQANGGRVADVYVGYARTSGQRVSLLSTRINVNPGTQTASVDIDLSPCLRDTDRSAPLSSCALLVDVALRDAANVVLDSLALSPVVAAPGAPAQAVSVDLDPAATIAVDECPQISGPLYYAAQDGTGPWTRVQPVSGKLHYRFGAGRGGIMSVSPLAGGFQTIIYYGARAELPTATFCRIVTPVGNVNGTITVGTPGEFVKVFAGFAFATVGAGLLTFTVPNAPLGLQDIVMTRSTFSTFPDGTPVFTPTRISVAQRSVTIFDGMTLAPVNVNASVAPQTAALTVSAGSGPNLTTAVRLVTSGPDATSPLIYTAPFTGVWYGLAATAQIASDAHIIELDAHDQGGSLWGAQTKVKNVQPVDVALTGPIPAATTTVLRSSPPRISVSQSGLNIYGGGVQVALAQSDSSALRFVAVVATAAYRSNAATLTFDQPDFTTLPGWLQTWNLIPGAATTVVTGVATPAGIAHLNVGDVARYAQRTATITP